LGRRGRSFTREEICDEIDRVQADCGIQEDPVELLDQLVSTKLSLSSTMEEYPDIGTRMAEAVRLFARLRQIRPWNTWQTARLWLRIFALPFRSVSIPGAI